MLALLDVSDPFFLTSHVLAGSPILFLLIVVAVILYHFGCWIEYRLGIEDTARVVPVHGMW